MKFVQDLLGIMGESVNQYSHSGRQINNSVVSTAPESQMSMPYDSEITLGLFLCWIKTLNVYLR